MNEITFKIASRGEGKTKWLLDIAHRAHLNHKVYLYTNKEDVFGNFCKKYFAMYNEVCPVYRYCGEYDKDCVILVDEMTHEDISMSDVCYMRQNCYKMFVTIEGTTKVSLDTNQYEQLTMNFME